MIHKCTRNRRTSVNITSAKSAQMNLQRLIDIAISRACRHTAQLHELLMKD
jgi:hypothetical protein